MKKILLVGNPNVGKSAVFSRLTGVHVVASNYPGTTVEFTEGSMRVGDSKAVLIDVPGIYGLEAVSKAEEIALEMLKQGDAAINVVDATNLERNLHLTLHLLEKDIPLVVALNLSDEAGRRGITIDAGKLEKLLGVPVVPTVGVTGQGVKELVARLPEASNARGPERTEDERWAQVGRVVSEVQTIEHRHRTFVETLGDASVMPGTGIPIAVLVLVSSFYAVRLIGENFTGYVFDPLFEQLWRPVVTALSSVLGSRGFLHSILIGELIEGEINFEQSFGLLTTGLYVPIGMVLPYLFSFYAVLGFLEDFGYLPRLAVLLDSIMHRMGLHGWAIIPTLTGLGCNVPGIMATRVLESRREKLIAATAVSVGVPCAALQAMIWGLLGDYGGGYVAIVYLTLLITWFFIGVILNMVLKGDSPELVIEVTPYRLPGFYTVFKKLWMRMVGFLREALPVVFIGIGAVNILYSLKVFDFLANLTSPVVTSVWGLPKETVVAIAVGFLRKDVAVGMLGTFDLTAGQLTVAATVLSMFFPCIATFVILVKELGARDTAKSVVVMVLGSLIVGGLLNVVL